MFYENQGNAKTGIMKWIAAMIKDLDADRKTFRHKIFTGMWFNKG